MNDVALSFTPEIRADLESTRSSQEESPMMHANIEDPRIWKVFEMLDGKTHYTVNELASAVHLSPSRLSKVFKEETGMKLGDYLNRQRLNRAAQMLIHTEESIKCIAYRVGYNHPSSFVRAFRSRFEESPKVYRRRVLRSLFAARMEAQRNSINGSGLGIDFGLPI